MQFGQIKYKADLFADSFIQADISPTQMINNRAQQTSKQIRVIVTPAVTTDSIRAQVYQALDTVWEGQGEPKVAKKNIQ